MTSEATAVFDELEAIGDNVDLGELAGMCDQVGLLLAEQGLFNLQEKYTRKELNSAKFISKIWGRC
jgi:hypothetical protein